jgi:hypothetical protein
MRAERIFPNYRKLYTYHEGNNFIAVRVIGPGCLPAAHYIHFNTATEAKAYFETELLS